MKENVLPLERANHATASHDGTLGSILIQDGKLAAPEVERVMALQRVEGLRFGEAAMRLALITADDLHRAIAKQYGCPDPLARSAGISSEIVAAYEPHDVRAEELRTLRTQLLIRWHNAGIRRQRMLAMVSPGRKEGRSYVAANLAVVFAQLGERTLLIDADLRAPRQHVIFNLPGRIGLSSVLAGRADRDDAVAPVPALGPLSVLPAGACPPNPQELLLRPAMAALLDELEPHFDVILFDTPPAVRYADAQSLAYRAGSALVIARRNHTRVGETAHVVRDLNDAGTNIVGTLFNVF